MNGIQVVVDERRQSCVDRGDLEWRGTGRSGGGEERRELESSGPDTAGVAGGPTYVASALLRHRDQMVPKAIWCVSVL